MAITKIHAVKVRLGDAINYIENPDKTDGQELISGYNTAPQTAVLDFSVTAAMARKARNTSAKKQGNSCLPHDSILFPGRCCHAGTGP